MKQLIDLSHTLEDGLVTYKGLPAPIICDYLSREDSQAHYDADTSFHIGRIDMCSNTGTYLDSPFHRYADGKDLSELTLDRLAGLLGIKVQVAENTRVITEAVFNGLDVRDKAVLIETNWSRHWNTEAYYENHPYLSEGAAIFLRDAGARLVGIDSYNIDDISDGRRPVHTVLLGAEVLIVEHMTNLAELPDQGFKFYAVPVKIKKFGTFPVRAFAELSD